MAHLAAVEDGTFFGMSFAPETRAVRRFGRARLDEELRDPSVFSWIDLQAPDIDALNRLLADIGFDLELTSHFDRPEVLPRIVERPDCLAFYLYEIRDPDSHLDTSSAISEIGFLKMILVLGADRVVTYHPGRLTAVAHVQRSCADAFRLAGKTPAFVAFLFLQECLHDFAHLNLANDNYLDALQEALLERGGRPATADVCTAGRNILTLKKLAASLQIVLTHVATRRSRFVSDDARASFAEMLSALASVRAGIESSQHLLDGIVAAMQAHAAQRTSEIARVLTVISGVLLPLTLITGIYGMNFRRMPELEWPWGYPLVLGVLAVLAIALLLLFRALGWLGRDRSR